MDTHTEFRESLLSRMTLAEKVALLSGTTMWLTAPIERLGIPAIKVTDGPNGARGIGLFGTGPEAACFPAGIALAATWNPDLVYRVGVALGEEAKTKGSVVLLAPTVNIHRSPLNGRNFECFSEDPYLSARMAVAYISGLQSQGVAATVKHYIGNESEFERNTISSEIGERALREIYLPPFEAAINEANSWTIMSSYNRLNGVYTGEHHELLTELLRDEWDYDGVVMSDWFATHSTTAAINAGMDLEMPGPTRWRGARLVEAMQIGKVQQATIDASVRRVLLLLERCGAFTNPLSFDEQSVDRQEIRAVARQSAVESIVLLKNKGSVLPIDLGQVKRIAVIGPNAKTARIMGAGSAEVNPYYAITPYAGIKTRVGDAAEIDYTIGCTNHRLMPSLGKSQVTLPNDPARPGMVAEYYNSPDLSGPVALRSTVFRPTTLWMDEVGPGVNRRQFSVRLTGRMSPEESGRHTFGLSAAGRARLFVNGQEVIDNWTEPSPGHTFFGAGSAEKTAAIDLTEGQPVELRIEYTNYDTGPLAGILVGCLPPIPDNPIQRAVELAAQADIAIVCVGLSGEWESEGEDRPHMDLVGGQNALVEAVAAANPRTIVVVQTGSPVTFPWLDRVAAVVEAWYPGQECGNAIADVLFGDVSPSGRLPQTFPLRLEDNPTYINYPGENGHVHYGEGIFVGYRYYEKKKVAPLFPFGFGLSYTTFAYSNLNLDTTAVAPSDTLRVSVDVTNTGARPGQEVVQVYVCDVAASVARPEKELKGFAKVSLQPGETQTVTVPLTREAFAYYDDRAHCWVAEAGEYRVLVGGASDNTPASASFTLTETMKFGGPPR